MNCPHCGRFMEKIYDITGVYYYKCGHCHYTSEFLTENNKPVGDNYPLFDSKKNWNYRKWSKLPELKTEHKKIIENMRKKYGKLTDKDKIDLLIDIWEFEHNKKKGGDKK